jgi:hypothetical protein
MTLAALLLAGCGSSLPDILGGGAPAGSRLSEFRGTVERVDSRDRILLVDAEETYRSGLRDGGEVSLRYDERTVVEHAGRTYRPEDLERGDRITARVERLSDESLLAREIDVLYDVSGGGQDAVGDLRGVVRYVDTRQRTLEIETSSARVDDRDGVLVVHYDSSTTVEYRGERYRPENLERGDEVEIEVRDLGNRLLAEQILVIADARGGA